MLIETIDNFKQWLRYPQEFRIGAPKYLELTESLELLTDSLKHPPINLQMLSENEEELIDMTADIGTLVWRVQRRLTNMGKLNKELQRVSRDLESTRDALTQRGIEIKDHTGQDYITGMVLRVIASQPVPGLVKQQIIETLKPTIYHKGKIIQMGDVIVGIPGDTGTTEPMKENT